MINLNVDLGQILLGGTIGTIGYFIKRTIDNLGARLDKHDELILGLVRDVQVLIGMNTGWIHKRKSDGS